MHDGQRVVVVERDDDLSAAALLPPPRYRVVDQDAAHGLRRNREEVAAVLPLNPIELVELEPGLVHERRRAERVIVALAPQLARRELTQLVVHEHEHLLHRGTRILHGPTIIRRHAANRAAPPPRAPRARACP